MRDYSVSVTFDDVEGVVVELCLSNGLDPTGPVSPWELARREAVVVETHEHVIGGACSYRVRDRWRIAIPRALSTEYAAHAVGHELGHVVLRRLGVSLDDEREERVCDAIGGAILAPAPAVLALHRAFGYDVRRIARAAVSTPTWAALRLGEALGIPTVMVAPHAVRTRATGRAIDESEARRIARGRSGRKLAVGRGRVAVFGVTSAG